MKITDLSVKRPVTTTVVYLALIVLGVFSLGRLAIDLIPDISFPVIVIYSTYPGVSPQEVEENLTKIMENTAASASRIEKISSQSREGTSVVIVEYQWGTDLAEASNDLRERLDLIREYIPEDASQPPRTRSRRLWSRSMGWPVCPYREACRSRSTSIWTEPG